MNKRACNWHHEETNRNNPQLRKLDVFPCLFLKKKKFGNGNEVFLDLVPSSEAKQVWNNP